MNEQEIQGQLAVVEEHINSIAVRDAETYEVAGRYVLDLDGLRRKIVDYWAEPKRKAFEAHKAITEKEKQMLRPIDDKRKLLDRKISDYLTEERRRRDEEQRKLDEQRRAHEQRQRERLMKKAQAEAAKGNDEKAEALTDQAENVYVAPVAVMSEVDQTTRTDSGTISQRSELEIRITDPMKLIQAIAEGAVPIGVVTISEAKLKQHIKLFKLRQLPGCAIEERVAASFRRAK
jgi:hypothetical protein